MRGSSLTGSLTFLFELVGEPSGKFLAIVAIGDARLASIPIADISSSSSSRCSDWFAVVHHGMFQRL